MTSRAERRPAGLRPAAVVLLLLGLCLGACARPERPRRPRFPVLLVTFEGLRADAVAGLGGEPGLTPHLDELIAEADWAGRGVAASGWAAPAAASILTGLPPWTHQVVSFERPRLASELVTLGEALGDLGYRSEAYVSGYWISARHRFGQGFGSFESLRRGGRAQARLRALRGDRELVWIHFRDPSGPWTRRDWALPGETFGALPRRLGGRQLGPYSNPDAPAPPVLRQAARALYRQSTAWADERLGRMLAALDASGHGDETLVVVTSTHGQSLGEGGEIGDGRSLDRSLLEVPLVIRLPEGFGRALAPPPDRPVATARVWATLVDAAGGEPPPGVAPSLLAGAPGAAPGRDVEAAAASPVLSELYQACGDNLFSLVDGDRQLLWRRPYAAGRGDCYRARHRLSVEPEGLAAESTRLVLERFDAAFRRSRPFTGREEFDPGLDPAPPAAETAPRLYRWTAQGGTEPLADEAVRRVLADELVRRLGSFRTEETSADSMARRWPSVRAARLLYSNAP
jgi:hypothetical protein